MRRKRLIIRIDEEKCDGCGLCVPACPEGAIQIIDGKARLVDERLCDGLGACIGECPKGAIQIEEREAEEFDLEAVRQHLESLGKSPEEIQHAIEHARSHLEGEHHAHEPEAPAESSRCPSSAPMTWEGRAEEAPQEKIPSMLRQWPVKLALVNPKAPFLNGKELLFAADCAPFAYGNFHPDFLKGKALIIGCPKLDDVGFYLEKLVQIFKSADLKGVHVVHMEVPCCHGLLYLVQEALARAGRDLPVRRTVVGIRGDIVE